MHALNCSSQMISDIWDQQNKANNLNEINNYYNLFFFCLVGLFVCMCVFVYGGKTKEGKNNN